MSSNFATSSIQAKAASITRSGLLSLGAHLVVGVTVWKLGGLMSITPAQKEHTAISIALYDAPAATQRGDSQPQTKPDQHSHSRVRKSFRVRHKIAKTSSFADTKTETKAASTTGIGNTTAPTTWTEYRPSPPYPEFARHRGWEGKILVELKADQNGNIQDAIIKEGSGYPILDDSALKTLRTWKVKPASKLFVPIVFRLNS